MDERSDAGRAARKADESPLLQVLARAGFAASGLVHILIGGLAIEVAVGGRGEESDQTGALAQLATSPLGFVILWAVVVGLSALALWFLVEAFLGEGSPAKRRWVRSVSAVSKAVPCVILAIPAFQFAAGGRSSAKHVTRDTSATILALPGGQLLLAAIGLVAVGIGGYFLYRGVSRAFGQDVDVTDRPARRPVLLLGVVGHLAKGLAIVVVGILFVVAAVTLDPGSATGIDGALKSLAALPYGFAVLLAVGIGLIAYGCYMFARARYAPLQASAEQ
jgi:hypothetical protein